MINRPLLVKSKTTNATGWIFNNPTNKNDKNVYGIVSYHSLHKYINLRSDTFQLVGNDIVKPTSEILLNSIYVYRNNFIMDMVFFIIVDTEKIRGTFLEPYLYITFNMERDIQINSVDIIAIFKGKASSTTVSIQDKNYIIGSNEDKLVFQELPEAGLILLDKIAKIGYSGSPIVNDGKIYGFISRSSGNFNNKEDDQNNCLAINIFYCIPWLSNTCDSIYKYIGDSKESINSLLNRDVIESILDNLTPSILTLGCYFIHYAYGNNSNRYQQGALIYLVNEYLDGDYYYRATDRQSTHSISYKSLMNSNRDFMNEFNSDVTNSTYFITKLTYRDRLNNNLTTIDYIKNSLNANINEYFFRGSSEHDVVVEIVKETRSRDNVSSSVLIYTFRPSRTNNENFNGVDYNRQSSELPKMYFNSIESLVYNHSSGLRLVENSYNTPSVDLARNGYPGAPFFNNYLSNQYRIDGAVDEVVAQHISIDLANTKWQVI